MTDPAATTHVHAPAGASPPGRPGRTIRTPSRSPTIADQRIALPGGPVWVHRGAITASQNEAQLASVLAHEVAHIAERHAADQITKGLVANGLLGLLGAVLGNDSSARAAQMPQRSQAAIC
jgi:predicted Zn-dependent protease